MAKQLIPKGIRVNAVASGPLWTPLQVCGAVPVSGISQFGGDVPLGRPGQPAEIASTYVLLATSESSYNRANIWCRWWFWNSRLDYNWQLFAHRFWYCRLL